jgi:hypothetical protein
MIQRYECVDGSKWAVSDGDYVLHTDHLAALADRDAEIDHSFIEFRRVKPKKRVTPRKRKGVKHGG